MVAFPFPLPCASLCAKKKEKVFYSKKQSLGFPVSKGTVEKQLFSFKKLGKVAKCGKPKWVSPYAMRHQPRRKMLRPRPAAKMCPGEEKKRADGKKWSGLTPFSSAPPFSLLRSHILHEKYTTVKEEKSPSFSLGRRGCWLTRFFFLGRVWGTVSPSDERGK